MAVVKGSPPVIGKSLSATGYRMKRSESEDYVRCGADLVLNGIREDVEAHAQCPMCGAPVEFKVRNQRVEALNAQSSLLHVVERQLDSSRTWVECDGSPLFDKEECLQRWVKNYKGTVGKIYTLQGYLDHRLSICRNASSNVDWPK